MKLNAMLALLLAVFCLGGCASPTVESTVAYFYQPPALENGTSVVVRSLDSQRSDLEFNHYKGLISEALVNAGFNVKAAGNADYDVFSQYAVDHRGLLEDYVVPQIHTYTNPSGGTTTYTTYSNRSRQVHQRELALRFFRPGSRNADTEPVLYIRLLSAGSTNEMAKLMPTFAEQIMKRWPGEPGKTYDVYLARK